MMAVVLARGSGRRRHMPDAGTTPSAARPSSALAEVSTAT